MCCCIGSRATLVLISVWAIVQSAVYIGMSVTGILVHGCDVAMDGSKFNYLMYITYFRDAACGGQINWAILELPTPAIEPVLEPVTSVVSRTNDFAYAYLILSCIWIVVSVSLIVATFTPCMSQLCLKVFSFPWIITCCAVLSLDAVATVIFIIDITKTTTIAGFLDFIGVINRDEFLPHAQSFPPYLLPIPAVVMMLVANRGVIFWAINISCLIYVIISVRKLVKNELGKKPKNRAVPPDFGYEREITSPEQRNANPQANQMTDTQMAEISRYNDASVQNQYQYDNEGFSPDPAKAGQRYNNNNNYVFVSEKRFLEPLKGAASRSEDGNSSRISNARSLDSVDEMSRTSSNLGNRSQSSSMDRTVDMDNEPAERLSYLSNESMLSENMRRNLNNYNSVSPQPILVKPSLIKQQQQQMRDNENMVRTSYQNPPPDELRSQLPWSYFQDRDVSRPLKQRSDKEVLPPVPVPDYTLHFPKKTRPKPNPKPGTIDHEGNEKWSGPEYTY